MAAGLGAATDTGPAAGTGEEEEECVKPFTPEKAKEIVMSLQQPAIFCNMVFDWPAQHWTAEHLSGVLHGKQIRFRMGMKSTATVPQFETTCNYVEATLEEFLTWNCDHSSISGPFRDYDYSKFWAYADYKYIVSLFEDKTDIFQDVRWSDFGFHGRNGRESTLWIGSLGAHTPCHLDSYGCNLVFQVQGRKRWHLFPPEDTPFLYPTRIPYEESSVFSKVSVVNPDLKRFPQFQKARRHVVTLSPGQVLFVPRHWWHYVESVDPVTVSINSWIELVCHVLPTDQATLHAHQECASAAAGMWLVLRDFSLFQEEDHQARVEEAITRTLVCALKTAEDPRGTRAWLNPTEVEETSHEVNCDYLNRAVAAFFDHRRTPKPAATRAPGTDGEELRAHRLAEAGQTGSQHLTWGPEQEAARPFGPDLVPVLPGSKEPPSERGGRFKNDGKNDGKDWAGGEGDPSGKRRGTKQRMTGRSEAAAVEQMASAAAVAASHTRVSTDDLLDCLVNPQVTKIVAQLLLQGRSL